MKNCPLAILVHGLGNDPAWWRPLEKVLRDLGIDCIAPAMPSLEAAGPDAWVDTILAHAAGRQVLLLGHSLGAAAALMAAAATPVQGLILCGLPPFSNDARPPAPPAAAALSSRALARVVAFLRKASSLAASGDVKAVHFVGETDDYVPIDLARKWPMDTRLVPRANHELNRSPHFPALVADCIVRSPFGARFIEPGARYVHMRPRPASPAAALGLDDTAGPPVRLDLEVTTKCQLKCCRCARAIYKRAPGDRDMDGQLADRIFEACRSVTECFLVGLGEPLLHPQLESFATFAGNAGMKARLVTNGLAATPARLAELARCGLAEVTFSMDTLDPVLFSRLRSGASLAAVLENVRQVPAGLVLSIFCTLSAENQGSLEDLIRLARELKLPAVAVSDVNFPENQERSLHRTSDFETLCRAIRIAGDNGILLIGPHFLDIPDIRLAVDHCVVRIPSDITGRSQRHTFCLAPWRTVVVGADGTVTPCNCAPDVTIGNAGQEPLESIWNGSAMRSWRASVRAGTNNLCLGCPRY